MRTPAIRTDGTQLDVHDEEHQGADHPEKAQDLDAKKVARVERLGVTSEKLLPGPWRLRSGAGSTPASAKISATVVRPISILSPRRASRIFV